MQTKHEIRLSAAVLILLVLATAMIAGAQADPSTTATAITAQYVYASNISTDQTHGLISGYRLGSGGKLTSVGPPVQISGVPTLVPSKLGAKLFGVGLTDTRCPQRTTCANKVWVFAVNGASGRLKLLSTVVFPSNQTSIGIGINPQSTLLFVGKVIDEGKPSEVRRISTYRINPSGTLRLISSTVVRHLSGIDGAASFVFDPLGKYMYATTGGFDFPATIAQFAVNQTTGVLTFVRSFPQENVGNPPDVVGNLVMHPSGRFLYASAIRFFPEHAFVKVFSVDAATGGLKEIQGIKSLPDFSMNIAIDPAGTLLFQAMYGGPTGIAPFTINTSTGMLTAQGGSFQPVEGANQVFFALDGTGKFLLANDADGIVSTYSIGRNGALTAVPGSQAPLPTTMDLLPRLQVVAVRAASAAASKFIYSNENGGIDAAQINSSTGQLTIVHGSPFLNATSTEVDSLVSHPSGKFLYTSAHAFSTGGEGFGRTGIDGFAIDSDTGTLTQVSGAPFLTDDQNPIAVHPSGKWLYLPGPGIYHVYAVDPRTGSLAEVPGSPFPAAGVSPFSEFSQDGRFLFNLSADAAIVFSIDQQSGEPTLIKGPVSTGIPAGQFEARETRVSADGRYVYVMANSPGIVIALAIASDGSLSPAPGSPFALENFSDGIAVDPLGRFLYASVRENTPTVITDKIQAFSVEPTTGKLNPVPGSPFKTNAEVNGIVVDRSGRFLYGAAFDKCLTFSIDSSTGTLTKVATSPGPRGGQFGLIAAVP